MVNVEVWYGYPDPALFIDVVSPEGFVQEARRNGGIWVNDNTMFIPWHVINNFLVVD